MYSQNQEESYIVNYFGSKKGNFLDIGGWHPYEFNNTRKLYELGWSGIYVEPSPICFRNFETEYVNEKRIELLNCAITSNVSGKIDFYEANGDALSTSNLQHKERWEKNGVPYKLIQVEALSTKDLENKLKQKINFLSLDVESTNLEIFNSLSNEFLFNLDMLCVEHDNQFNTIINRMVGFRIIYQNGENLILAK
jgi:FkbM family methyltransferase